MVGSTPQYHHPPPHINGCTGSLTYTWIGLCVFPTHRFYLGGDPGVSRATKVRYIYVTNSSICYVCIVREWFRLWLINSAPSALTLPSSPLSITRNLKREMLSGRKHIMKPSLLFKGFLCRCPVQTCKCTWFLQCSVMHVINNRLPPHMIHLLLWQWNPG